MSYLSTRFPDSIASDPVGGPGFKTEIAATQAGFEQRDERWPEALHTYEFSHGVKSSTHFRQVGAHFRMARGRLHKFRVRDWSDYRCERRDGSLNSITATEFQIHKVYGDEVDFAYERRITRIYPESLQIWKDNVPLALTADYDLDEETGIVTFVLAPGAAVLACAFEFDVPCRYDTDQLQATLVMHNHSRDSYHAWRTVPLVEVRE